MLDSKMLPNHRALVHGRLLRVVLLRDVAAYEAVRQIGPLKHLPWCAGDLTFAQAAALSGVREAILRARAAKGQLDQHWHAGRRVIRRALLAKYYPLPEEATP